MFYQCRNESVVQQRVIQEAMTCYVEFVYQSSDYICKFTKKLNIQRLNGAFCDVVLVAEGVEFPAHRCVLAASTDYFDVMFKIDMAERTQSRIVLAGVTANALNRLLDYLYTGSLCITNESLVGLIFLSSLFMMFDVAENCWNYFVETLDETNCIERKIFADSVSSKNIAQSVSAFVLQNFTKLDTKSVIHCPFEILHELFLHHELSVENEFDVFRVFLKWCAFNFSEKEKFAEILLNAIRFGFVSFNKENLESILSSYGILNQSVIYSLILRRIEREVGVYEPRLSYKNEEVIISVGGHSTSSVLNNLSVYIPSNNKWYELSAMIYPRRSFGLVVSNNNLFVVGGTMEKSREHPVPFIERYDTHKDTWEGVHLTVTSNLERDHAAVVSFGGNIVLTAGVQVNSGQLLSSVIELNPVNGEWRNLACLNVAREGHAAVATVTGIYVIGGKGQSEVLDSVEKYDVETETWCTLQPMTIKRYRACAVSFNQKLFVFGGFDGENVLSSGEVYDPGTECWQPLPDMATARMKFGLSVFNDCVYVIGGINGPRGPMVADVEKFNILESSWSLVSSMKEERMENNCATINIRYKFLKHKL